MNKLEKTLLGTSMLALLVSSVMFYKNKQNMGSYCGNVAVGSMLAYAMIYNSKSKL